MQQTRSHLQPRQASVSTSHYTRPSGPANDDTHITPAGYSGRLVYAKPEDLPSFPSLGLKPNASAASAAATLGWNNRKLTDLWKPDRSASASAAAALAQEHKMSTLTPMPMSPASNQAAILAHRTSPLNSDITHSPGTDHGHFAAIQAFKTDQRSSHSPQITNLNRQRSLMAAKDAMKSRPRAQTVPGPKQSYPDEANAAANALKAASRAHGPGKPPAINKNAGAVPYTTMNRQMFTSRPLAGKSDPGDQNWENSIHASALAMAKRIYNQQQKLIEQTKKAHANDQPSTPRRRRSSSSLSDEVRPMQFSTLQDKAYQLAQERLAKLHEENLKNREFQEYYGSTRIYPRLSGVRAKLRRRSSSDGAVIEDRQKSQQIRKQMSIFSTRLSEVDQKKRQQDRDAVLAAAHRNVQAQLRGIDEKIAAETGMVPPSTLTQWESKAHAGAQVTAQAHSDERMSKHGKIDIGAGKYMDKEEIKAIAVQRVQPLLDEINQKAEKEHARKTELRLEAEKQKEAKEIEKNREKEVADIAKRLKEAERQAMHERRIYEKQEARAKKEEEKAGKAEHKRLARIEKRKSAPVMLSHHERCELLAAPEATIALNDIDPPVRVPAPADDPAPVITQPSPEPVKTSRVPIRKLQIPRRQNREQRSKSDSSSPTDKVKMWFKTRFSKRGSKATDDNRPNDNNRRSFIGGAALTGISASNSVTSVDNRSASVRAVAMAGRRRTEHSPDTVSPLSSSSSDLEFFRDEAREGVDVGLTSPRPIRDPAIRKTPSPVRDSRFHEMM